MIENAGIELPAMYKLGYQNNNCIGCVKGESGYWNKIRKDFPDTFERMAQIEEKIGRYVCRVHKGNDYKFIPLRELPVNAGNYKSEANIECGIFCHMAEQEYRE